MKIVKKTKEHTIYQKRSGRYAVQDKDNKFINGQDKADILAKGKFIKLVAPKKVEEPEAPAQEAAQATEAKADEAAPAEEAKA